MNRGSISRRSTLTGGGALIAQAAFASPVRGLDRAFSWQWLQAQALALACRPYAPFLASSPALAAPSYDDRMAVQFRADRDLPGGVRPFPAWSPSGPRISYVEHGRASEVAYSNGLFSGPEDVVREIRGFNGFRVMTADRKSDWLAFQDASYFRTAGPLDQYGLSMRGLAIDTGLSTPEEFPAFIHFWIEPGPDDAITVYALLDSPSVAGAWRFVNRRSKEGVVQDVGATMRFRRQVTRLGIAPCTSMFWYGEGNRGQAVDWRPEIHDSDGLAMQTGRGERIWRPLNNPPQVATSSFVDRNPRGFGLLQRDRAFDHYQDDAVFYERRPNLWVEPMGDWGSGTVMLVELPTAGETADNIVAFWSPAEPPRAGQQLSLAYRLHWTAEEPPPSLSSRVVESWRGVAGPPGSPPLTGATRLVAEFAGPALAGLGADSGVVEHVTLSRGTPIHTVAYPVATSTDRWRLIVDVQEPGDQPLDMRAFLGRGVNALSETLAYQFVTARQS